MRARCATWRTRLNLFFLRPSRVHHPNGKSIGSAALTQLAAGCHQVHWRHLANTIELMLPLAHPSPQPKRQLDRFSRCCKMTAEYPYTLLWDALFFQKLSLLVGRIWTSIYNTWFPGPTRVLNLNGISIGATVFAGLNSVTERQTNRLVFTARMPPVRNARQTSCPMPSSGRAQIPNFRPRSIPNL